MVCAYVLALIAAFPSPEIKPVVRKEASEKENVVIPAGQPMRRMRLTSGKQKRNRKGQRSRDRKRMDAISGKTCDKTAAYATPSVPEKKAGTDGEYRKKKQSNAFAMAEAMFVAVEIMAYPLQIKRVLM